MKLKRLWLPFGLAIFTLSIAYAGDSPDGGLQPSMLALGQGQRDGIGNAPKTTENMLTLETEKRTTRNFTLKLPEIEGVTQVQGGGFQRTSSTMGQGHSNVIGTISKTTENMLTLETENGAIRNFTVKSAKIDGVTKLQPGDRVLLELDEGNQIIGIKNIAGEKHQLVHGEVVGIDQNKKTITLKFKNGTSQSYGMKEAMAGKMNNIEKGAVVTLMIDQHNNLAMDVHVD